MQHSMHSKLCAQRCKTHADNAFLYTSQSVFHKGTHLKLPLALKPSFLGCLVASINLKLPPHLTDRPLKTN